MARQAAARWVARISPYRERRDRAERKAPGDGSTAIALQHPDAVMVATSRTRHQIAGVSQVPCTVPGATTSGRWPVPGPAGSAGNGAVAPVGADREKTHEIG